MNHKRCRYFQLSYCFGSSIIAIVGKEHILSNKQHPTQTPTPPHTNKAHTNRQMVSSRKSRMLTLSAVLLIVMFIFVTSHRGQGIPSTKTTQTSSSRIGNIDEGAIKSNEDKIKLKLKELGEQDSKDSKDIKDSKDKGNGNGNAVVTGAKGVIMKGESSPTKVDDDASFDAAKEFQSIMGLSPVVMFSKTYCGYSKALKNLLSSEYEISPQLMVVELDKHKKGAELQEYIGSKTGRMTVPNLFISGVSRGGSDDIKKLHDEGTLLKLLQQWGGKSLKVTKISAPSNS